jgi:hypothetical protein
MSYLFYLFYIVHSSTCYVFHVPNSLQYTSRQSAKLSLQSSVLGLPHPLTRRRVCLPPLIRWEGHTLLREKRWGTTQFQRGDRHCGILVYMYFVVYYFSICVVESADVP